MSEELKQAIQKCEQYWNETGISDAEVHAMLGFIHSRCATAATTLASQAAEIERLREDQGHVARRALQMAELSGAITRHKRLQLLKLIDGLSFCDAEAAREGGE